MEVVKYVTGDEDSRVFVRFVKRLMAGGLATSLESMTQPV